MATIVGRGIRVEIGITEGAPKAISAITLTKPAKATSTAHGLANKSVGYLTGIGGMVQLEGQAVRVANQTTNDFDLENINTVGSAAFTGGNFVPVTAWATLSESTSYQIPDGTADKLDDTTLLDDFKKEINGLLAAQSFSIATNAQDANNTAMQAIEDAANSQAYVVVRITLKSGFTRIFRGQPSLPGENVQKGAIGTGSINFAVKGVIVKGAA